MTAELLVGIFALFGVIVFVDACVDAAGRLLDWLSYPPRTIRDPDELTEDGLPVWIGSPYLSEYTTTGGPDDR